MSFPLPVHKLTLPAQEVTNPLPSHCHTQPRLILHFLWSILESIQEYKQTHARHARAHTHTHTSHSLTHTHTHRRIDLNVKEQEKKGDV